MGVITDSVADMLTRIRNATVRRHRFVPMPSSKLRVELARNFKEQGFIEDYEVIDDHPQPALRIALKYTAGGDSVITGLKRISTPGRRIYKRNSEIPWVLSGMGVVIMSTSQGVITGRQARRAGVGGEVVCYIW